MSTPSAWTRRYGRWQRMSQRERLLLLACAGLLPLVWLRLRLLGLGHCQAWLASTPAGSATADEADIALLSESVARAARHSPWPTSCLTRSLLLAWLLRRRGVVTTLRIGVRRAPGELEAHAWLERDGVPLNDAPDIAGQFAALR